MTLIDHFEVRNGRLHCNPAPVEFASPHYRDGWASSQWECCPGPHTPTRELPQDRHIEVMNALVLNCIDLRSFDTQDLRAPIQYFMNATLYEEITINLNNVITSTVDEVVLDLIGNVLCIPTPIDHPWNRS